jgi:Tfp pilus assembly protein PilP
MMSYVFVSVVAVGLAFMISLKFLGRSYSQGANMATGASPSEETASQVAAEVQGFLEPFIYESKNRRDPFQAYADYRPAEPTNILATSPLQRYDLEEFHLIGVMWDIHNPKAMFVDPDKRVHVIGRDESIGKRNGYIAAIREGEVVVVESVRQNARTVFQPKVLRMER